MTNLYETNIMSTLGRCPLSTDIIYDEEQKFTLLQRFPEQLATLVKADIAQQTTVNQGSYSKNRYNLVSIIGYLIGIEEARFSRIGFGFQSSIFEELNAIPSAKIIRALCTLRNQLMNNFNTVKAAINYEGKSIYSLSEIIDKDNLSYIHDNNITIDYGSADVVQCLINTNQAICSRITTIKNLFPTWLNWEYIKLLFIMPRGTTSDGVKFVQQCFVKTRNYFPFQKYVNIDFQNNDGCILLCDEKFVKYLYSYHADTFDNLSLVRNVSDSVANNISDFLKSSSHIVVSVDCENSDPIKFASFINSLPEASQKRINKILLFDSIYTDKSWKVFANTCSLPIVYHMVDRIKETKSQVDMKLASETIKEVYKEGADAVILASSDSDYWALINSVDASAKFLVLLEHKKTGQDIKRALSEKNISYCYLDDFNTDISYQLKTRTLLNELNSILSAPFSINLWELLDKAISSTHIKLSDSEKNNLFSQYLCKISLNIDTSGNISLHV